MICPFLAIVSLVTFTLMSTVTASTHGATLTNCTDRASALAHLSKTYKEQPIAMGLASSGVVVEVLTDDKGLSWSIIVTLPSGVTCLVVVGESWEVLQLIPKEDL